MIVFIGPQERLTCDELCDVSHDAPPVCEGLARWPEVNIPRYAHLNGQRFYADFIFPASDEYTWSQLSTLFISCYAHNKKSSSDSDDVRVSTDSIRANPTMWGLGLDYSDWTHWLIAIAIILVAIQLFGMIGYFMRKSKNKNLQVFSKIFICQHCFVSTLAKKCAKFKKKRSKKAKKKGKY